MPSGDLQHVSRGVAGAVPGGRTPPDRDSDGVDRGGVPVGNRWEQGAGTGEASLSRFAHPVSVLLFNRPDYALITLESLRDQTLPVSPERLIVSIDGYPGSKDEALGKADRTGEVAELARTMFPGATVRSAPFNLGIARHFALVEQLTFDDDAQEWATFFEEDFELAPSYLEVMTELIAHVHAEGRIVQVSATGDTMVPEATDAEVLRPMFHAWAFALRRSHYLERKAIIDAYLEELAEVPYYQRDHVAVISRLVDFGLYPIGSAQDRVKQAIRKHFGVLAVTTARPYGRYIGVEGEHSTPESFAELGYDNPPSIPDEVPEFDDAVAALVPVLVREDQRAWARELNAVWESRLEGATAEAERRSADAEARLAEAAEAAAQTEARASAIRDQLADRELQLEATERELRTMLDSRSWRVTGALRMLGGGSRIAASRFRGGR